MRNYERKYRHSRVIVRNSVKLCNSSTKMNGQGIAPYAKSELFGHPASIVYEENQRNAMLNYWYESAQVHKIDRVRRKAEKDLNWDMVKELLDLGYKLEEAKRLAAE